MEACQGGGSEHDRVVAVIQPGDLNAQNRLPAAEVVARPLPERTLVTLVVRPQPAFDRHLASGWDGETGFRAEDDGDALTDDRALVVQL